MNTVIVKRTALMHDLCHHWSLMLDLVLTLVEM